jgi:hypothetical protein
MSYDVEEWTSSLTCAKTWLDDCTDNHSTCTFDEDADFYPTRLLNIGNITSPLVFLETDISEPASLIRYATLSHCWGGSNVLRLTTSTMLRMQRGIPIADLAKTFQDAIFVAQQLGVHRIWIDSLCIAQDSKEDWERESSLMSQVYRHAIVNIAATVAPDSDAGCLPARSRRKLERGYVQSEWNNTENHQFHIKDRDMWSNALRHLPLVGRAWVVQELFLAPRVLYITRHEMLWECYGKRASERYPQGPLELLDGGKSWSREQKWRIFGSKQALIPDSARSDHHQKSDDEGSKQKIMELWRGIVYAYTKCSLTFSSDKLVALSGVAKAMQIALQDEYCAGLWRSRLIVELSWDRESMGLSALVEPAPYRAPSWSWASCEGTIQTGLTTIAGVEEFAIDVLHCNVTTKTQDRTGAVTSADLRLCCPLATLRLERITNSEKWNLFYNRRCWTSEDKGAVQGFNVHLDRPLPSSAYQVHCLPLLIRPRFMDIVPSCLSCLLLEPTGKNKGQFRRIGLLNVFDIEKNERAEWKQPHLAVNDDWMEYETAYGDGRYIISII